MFTDILLYAGAFVAGLVVALKVIAPRTKNKVDDKILVYAQDLEELLGQLGHTAPAAAVKGLAV